MSGSGTHSPKTSTVQEVSVFHEVLHCTISHTPRELLQFSSHTLPFCTLDCYCQPCSLSVVLVSQGHAILVLLNKQIRLLQALFITPPSVLCLRPQSFPVTALDTCKSKDFPESMVIVGETVETEPKLNQLSHLASHHTQTLTHFPPSAWLQENSCTTPSLFSAFSSQQNPRLHPSSWQGSKIYSSPVGMRAPCLKLQLKIKTASSVFTTTWQASSSLEHESCS